MTLYESLVHLMYSFNNRLPNVHCTELWIFRDEELSWNVRVGGKIKWREAGAVISTRPVAQKTHVPGWAICPSFPSPVHQALYPAPTHRMTMSETPLAESFAKLLRKQVWMQPEKFKFWFLQFTIYDFMSVNAQTQNLIKRFGCKHFIWEIIPWSGRGDREVRGRMKDRK